MLVFLTQLTKLLGHLLFLLFVFLVAVLLAWGGSRHFAPYEAPSAFLQTRQVHYAYFLPALYVHVISSPIVLFLGGLGLSPYLRRRTSLWHQRLGKIYVVLILGAAAPSGFVMAFFALGGFGGVLCFILLALLWAWTTWKAWRLAVRGDWEQHGWFMRRSFILTTSAFFLRLFSFLGAYFGNFRGPDIYVLWAWLSWLFPLTVLELWRFWSLYWHKKSGQTP